MSDPAGVRRGPFVMSLFVILVTLTLLPFASRHLGTTTSYVPAVLSVVACFDLMSMWLLAGEYADTGDRRMLAMAIAYLWSLTMMSGYAVTFPGVISAHPALAVTPSVAPYLYVGWHAGFPILLGAAWSPWAALDRVDKPGRRPRTMGAATLATVAVALGAIAGCIVSIHRLPVIIHGLDTTAMSQVTGPFVLPLVTASLVVCVRGVRTRRGPERWTQLTIVVCLCDLLLTYVSRSRFSFGWYAGRTLTMAAAATVLIAMLVEFRRLKATADFHAANDALTGLSNRRSTYEGLTAMIAQAHRQHAHLTVVLFDLDHFKEVNDTHGHTAGDIVLRAVAQSMRATVRDTDLVGRIGGEEFLILLPDATHHDAELVIERLRAALRLTGAPYLESGVTASFGVAALHAGDTSADDLINRADQAMYQAKAAGRDCTALAAEPAPGLGPHARP